MSAVDDDTLSPIDKLERDLRDRVTRAALVAEERVIAELRERYPDDEIGEIFGVPTVADVAACFAPRTHRVTKSPNNERQRPHRNG